MLEHYLEEEDLIIHRMNKEREENFYSILKGERNE